MLPISNLWGGFYSASHVQLLPLASLVFILIPAISLYHSSLCLLAFTILLLFLSLLLLDLVDEGLDFFFLLLSFQ